MENKALIFYVFGSGKPSKQSHTNMVITIIDMEQLIKVPYEGMLKELCIKGGLAEDNVALYKLFYRITIATLFQHYLCVSMQH